MPERDNLVELGATIHALRKDRGLTLKEMKAKSGISTGHLSNIEKAYAKPGAKAVTPPDEKLRAIAAALKVPVERFHAILGRGGGSPPQTITFPVSPAPPVKASAPEGDPLLKIGRYIDIGTLASIPLSTLQASAGDGVALGDPDRADGTLADAIPGGVEAIRIKGDCMEPDYHDGDIILVRRTDRVKHGDNVIATTEDGEQIIFKQFHSDKGKGRRLEPVNGGDPRVYFEREYKIIGTVAGSFRIGR